jgi:hypothetical protein
MANDQLRETILNKLKALTSAFQSREPELDKLNSFPYFNRFPYIPRANRQGLRLNSIIDWLAYGDNTRIR